MHNVCQMDRRIRMSQIQPENTISNMPTAKPTVELAIRHSNVIPKMELVAQHHDTRKNPLSVNLGLQK